MKLKKYGVWVFDSRLKKYGGFNHFIAGKIFNWRLDYLYIGLTRKLKFEVNHKREDSYYDGYHNHIWIGPLIIAYGT